MDIGPRPTVPRVWKSWTSPMINDTVVLGRVVAPHLHHILGCDAQKLAPSLEEPVFFWLHHIWCFFICGAAVATVFCARSVVCGAASVFDEKLDRSAHRFRGLFEGLSKGLNRDSRTVPGGLLREGSHHLPHDIRVLLAGRQILLDVIKEQPDHRRGMVRPLGL